MSTRARSAQAAAPPPQRASQRLPSAHAEIDQPAGTNGSGGDVGGWGSRGGEHAEQTAEQRFELLFRATYEDLLRFTERRIHPLAAEDVVAEVFVAAWRGLGKVPDEHDQARAWLFGIAHRLLAGQRRTEARRGALTTRIGQVLPPEADPDGTEHVISQVDLARAWALLRPSDQEALTMSALDELSNAHAAGVLGISTTAFSVRLVRARRRLRVLLDAPARRARLRPIDDTTPGGTR